MDTVAGIHRRAHSGIMIIDPSICQQPLESWLSANPAESILAIGEGTERVFERYRRTHQATRLTTVCARDLENRIGELDRHDLALVANTLEYIPKGRAEIVLSRLRDMCSERLYLLLPTGKEWEGHESRWHPIDLVAFGLVVAERYTVDGKSVRLFCHDLYDYKQTPDWLNAKHWANPELWDKFRW